MAIIERLTTLYCDVLSERLGYDPLTSQGLVAFSPVDGIRAGIHLYERDPEYLHLVAAFPPPEQEKQTVAQLCNQTTARRKCVKASIQEDGAFVVSVEMLVAGPNCLPTRGQLEAVLPRAISQLLVGIQDVLTGLVVASMEQ